MPYGVKVQVLSAAPKQMPAFWRAFSVDGVYTGTMAAKHTVIYVPGLGDARVRGQRLLFSSWLLWRVQPVLFRMNWADGEFAPKFQRLLGLIDSYHDAGHRVSLVGSSAGASAVINAFAVRKDALCGVVCICGKLNNPENIGKDIRRDNPAFVESAYMVQHSLDALDFDADRSRIQSRYALFDPIVPKEDSVIAGADNRMVPTIGHATSIASQMLFGAPFFVKFLQQRSKC